MTTCEVCGNSYDKSFQIVLNGESHFFDSFECAIQALAPRCEHCDCRIIGHGVEVDEKIFCCANCANTQFHAQMVKDRMITGVRPPHLNDSRQ